MDNHHGSKFFDGLMFGALLGAGAVFLLGTKKGKKLLHAITEQGLEGVSEIGDLLEEYQEEDLEEEPTAAAPKPKSAKPKTEKIIDAENVVEEEQNASSQNGESSENGKSKSPRRFFRRIKKS